MTLAKKVKDGEYPNTNEYYQDNSYIRDNKNFSKISQSNELSFQIPADYKK